MFELSTTLNVYVGIALSFAIIFKTIDVIMDCVQTSKDLEEEAKNKAYNFKKFHSIEYFSREDLEIIVADIKTKIIEYFAK